MVCSPARRTGTVFQQARRALTYIPDEPGRISDDQPVVRHIASDDSSGPHHGEPADRHTGQDGAPAPNRRAILNHDSAHDPVSFGFQPPFERYCPWLLVIQEA